MKRIKKLAANFIFTSILGFLLLFLTHTYLTPRQCAKDTLTAFQVSYSDELFIHEGKNYYYFYPAQDTAYLSFIHVQRFGLLYSLSGSSFKNSGIDLNGLARLYLFQTDDKWIGILRRQSAAVNEIRIELDDQDTHWIVNAWIKEHPDLSYFICSDFSGALSYEIFDLDHRLLASGSFFPN